MTGQRIRRPAIVCSKMPLFPDHFLILVILVLASGSACAFAQRAPTRTGTPPATVKAPNQDGYVGSAACAHCHRSIAASFAKTSMGRSLTPFKP